MTDETDGLGAAYDARLMRRLLGYLRPHRRAVAAALAAIGAGALLQLAYPWLTKIAIDDHITPRALDGLDRIAAAWLGVLIASAVVEYVQTRTLQMMGQRIMCDLRLEIYRHLQRVDVRFYDRTPVGRLMTRVTTDVDALNDLFASGVITVVRDVVMLVGIMAAMLILDWRLALVTFAVLPAIAGTTHWFRTNARASYRRVRGLIARINAFLQENLTGMATVQAFGREARQLERFAAINRAHRDANVASIVYYAVFYPAVELLGAVATALILWYGGGRAIQSTVELGALVAFIQYAQNFFRPISDLSEKFNLLQAAMASSERIFGLLDTPAPAGGALAETEAQAQAQAQVEAQALAAPRPGAAPTVPSLRDGADGDLALAAPRPGAAPGGGGGGIRFERVRFAYRDGDDVLRGVSFEVAPGERVGIVGATGAGKTTLINLLMRFYDVTGGRITVDGVDVRTMPLAHLRRRFGLVLQDVQLFSGSVRENIRLGDRTIDDASIRAAAAAVHADRVLDRLPGGLDAELGERGATLSVGQRQLLSFARALAFAPDVLLLDEATSSVDTDTERLIQDALRVLMAGRTTIAIAHRLSTVQDMDRILLFHRGELREAGTHRELLARGGLYYALHQVQHGPAAPAADRDDEAADRHVLAAGRHDG